MIETVAVILMFPSGENSLESGMRLQDTIYNKLKHIIKDQGNKRINRLQQAVTYIIVRFSLHSLISSSSALIAISTQDSSSNILLFTPILVSKNSA